VGTEARTQLLTALGPLAPGRVRRSLVLYDESPVLLTQSVFTRHEYTVAESDRSFEGHLSYDFKPRLWIPLDANYWFGGSTSLNGVQSSATLQGNSRVGLTASVPPSRHQSIKLSYKRRCLHQIRRELPECLCCVAILMARQTKLESVTNEHLRFSVSQDQRQRETLLHHPWVLTSILAVVLAFFLELGTGSASIHASMRTRTVKTRCPQFAVVCLYESIYS